MCLQNRKINPNFKQCNHKQVNIMLLLLVSMVLMSMEKALFDAITNFGVKTIACRDIVALDY